MNRKPKRRVATRTAKGRGSTKKPRRSKNPSNASRPKRQPVVKTKPVPVIDDRRFPPAEQIFSGSRPATMIRGLEPAFLLFEREILERIETRAEQLGVRYESLVRQIVRDNLDRY
jgi:hypothetical protein